jgi:hypothetical protein
MGRNPAEKPARRLSKFSNADANPRKHSQNPATPPAGGEGLDEGESFAHLVETVFAGQRQQARQSADSTFRREERDPARAYEEFEEARRLFEAEPFSEEPEPEFLRRGREADRAAPKRAGWRNEAASARLIEELDRIQQNPHGQEQPPHLARGGDDATPAEGRAAQAPGGERAEEESAKAAERKKRRRWLPRVKTPAIFGGLGKAARGAAKAGSLLGRAKPGAAALAGAGRAASRYARAKTPAARYKMMLAALHTHLFDRRVERLLFVSTARAADAAGAGPQPDSGRDYIYDGPIPRMVFGWAAASLPQDLRSFAFVDFRAGNGRTALLASAHRFEVIYGYVFSQQAYEDLELNIAQYPRSLMA